MWFKGFEHILRLRGSEVLVQRCTLTKRMQLLVCRVQDSEIASLRLRVSEVVVLRAVLAATGGDNTEPIVLNGVCLMFGNPTV